MAEGDFTLSIVIPTYHRERILVETVGYLLDLANKTAGFLELLVIDQTPQHDTATELQLSEWGHRGVIQWIRLDKPHLTGAMNLGLLRSRGEIVLFLDDDILPGPGLLNRHLEVYRQYPDAWAIVGQVLQPGEKPKDLGYAPQGGRLWRYLDFPFSSRKGMYIENAMAGNLSVKREKALTIGGFDENFSPTVAFRFETEFAKRLVASGGKIWFEPEAFIQHLRAERGGTRSLGNQLNSISPRYGVGDYYFALRWGQGWERLWYIARRPWRSARTRFHLNHPWWIPGKLTGEFLAFWQAIYLYLRGPKLLESKKAGDYE